MRSRCARPATSFVRPHVIRLLQYVRVPRAVKRRISRRALFARDGWKCVYCGTTARAADARPRDPALEGRRLGLGERRHGVRAVQPPQGRPSARGRRDVAPHPPRAPAPVLFIRLAAQRCRRAGASTCRRSSSSSPRPPESRPRRSVAAGDRRRPRGRRGTSRRPAAVVVRSRISLQSRRDLGIERVPAEDGVEPVAERPRRNRPRDEQVEVDPVARERLERVVERSGAVVGRERERGAPLAVAAVEARVGGDRDEPRVRLRDGHRRCRR